MYSSSQSLSVLAWSTVRLSAACVSCWYRRVVYQTIGKTSIHPAHEKIFYDWAASPSAKSHAPMIVERKPGPASMFQPSTAITALQNLVFGTPA